MVLKVLPNDVRSMLCASSQINDYKKAVEELVCNSLDAESTSIAIRVNIQECKIQVIDNGYGISKNDFEVLGQRYMTSKLPDISTLRSIPKYYGNRGEFLANIIEISENVKITSRHKDGEDTWAKIFCRGKNEVIEITNRPSKGTTVDISGFLYNQRIQKQGINTVNDLQNIKSFLEQLSLVHNAISLSLRDDSKNEIIFKIHKKRDIYQTLSTLFNIEKPMVQELHVQKNQYKIKGLIGKSELDIEKRWVFLNGKFINNGSKLHKIINGFMKKHFGTENKNKFKIKNNYVENYELKKHIPFYFIFITCPYIDYDLSSRLAQSLLQFKNWDQIKMMLEKLIKLYVGDINLKEINNPKTKTAINQVNHKNIRDNQDQIKKIIDRILGKNLKTTGPLRLQNGVKGEFIKRKKKSKLKNNISKKSGSNTVFTKQTKILKENHESNKYIQSRLSNNINEEFSQKQDITNTNKDGNIINKENKYSQIMLDNKTNYNLNYSLPKNVDNSLKIKKKSNKIYNNMSRKKTVRQKTNDSEFLDLRKRNRTENGSYEFLDLRKSGIYKSRKKNELLNIGEFVKNTESIFLGNEQTARAKAFYKQGNNVHNNTVKQKAYKFINGINDFEKPINLRHNRWDYNLDGMRHKFRTKPFKSTYDLVKTILETPHENNVAYNDSFKVTDRKQNSFFYNRVTPSIESKPPQNFNFSNNVGTDSLREKISNIIETSNHVLHCNLRCEQSYCKSQFTNIQNFSNDLFKKPLPKHNNLKLNDIFENISNIYSVQNAQSDFSNTPPISTVTYKSHNYNTNTLEQPKLRNYQHQYANKLQTMRFITDQSRDNVTRNQIKFVDRNQKGLYMLYKKNINQNITVNKSYTIEYTSNEHRSSEQSKRGIYYVGSKTHYTHKTRVLNYEPISGFGNTYTVSNHCSSSEYDIKKTFQAKYTNCKEPFANNSDTGQNYISYTNLTGKLNNISKDNNINFIFLSESRGHDAKNVLQEVVEPLDVCQTVYLTNATVKETYSINKNGNNCGNFCGDCDNQVVNHDYNQFTEPTTELRNRNRDDISHHFSNTLIEKCPGTVKDIECNIRESTKETNAIRKIESNIHNHSNENNECDKSETIEYVNNNNFDLKNRPRFLPKGMSQIFDKCAFKTACDYNLEEEYYSNVLYNDFANDVRMQSEIYEPKIQNVAEFSTIDINKFKYKIHKENTSLSFDERSLKEAQVLNQVDSKFIAATIKEKYKESENASEFVVLFDQHAVHERIRLEKNLSDYFFENKWTSTALDKIKLKLSRDEIIYLHNYKNKFNLLGLHWTTVSDNEILLNGIPEAILGKSPREVDKVIKAVKYLIMEEINIIKSQKGCISLYPKSIMDLVFSEACRYAIKFGDKLSRNDCIQLIKDLSICKTPFQCAHGRPVMAVLFEMESDMHAYKVDPASLYKFRSKTKM